MSASHYSVKSMKGMAEHQNAGSMAPKYLIQSMKFKAADKGYADDKAIGVTCFNDIPIELHRAIALFCENDRDLAAYGALTKDTFSAVYGYGGIWRHRFNDKFDYSYNVQLSGGTSAAYEVEYKFRTENIAKSNLWEEYDEFDILKVLITLIRESFQIAPGQETSTPVESKNMKFVLELVRKLGLLNNFNFFNTKTGHCDVDDLALNAVRVALLPWTLERTYLVWGYENSRNIAFSTLGMEPLYHHWTFEINHKFILHVGNFFARHCSAHPENAFGLGTLFQNYDVSIKPKIWNRPLRNGLQAIGNSWLGMSAKMVKKARKAMLKGVHVGENVGMDYMNENDFDAYDIKMSNPNDKDAPKLSDFYENLIRTLPPMELLHHMDIAEPKLTHLPFQGYGFEGDTIQRFEIVGNIYALPSQGNIPGWQHVSFLKYYPTGDRGRDFGWLKYTTLDEVRDGDCDVFAYEGILLPGNKVMVGRWFHPKGPRPEPTDDWEWSCAAGPEVLWCIDTNETERRKFEQEMLPIEIVHNTIAPRDETLPKAPTGLEWLWDEELRIPPPLKDLTVKKPKWGLLFRREEHYEIFNNLPVCCSLALTPIEPEYWGVGLPTLNPSSVAPQEQYCKMMDLWEAEKNVEKVESEEEKRVKMRLEIAECRNFKFGKYRRGPNIKYEKRSKFILDSIYKR